MAENRYGRERACGAGSAASRIGFIESQSPPAVAAFGFGEQVHGFFAQQAFTAVFAAVEPHLRQLCQIVGVGKQSGVTRNSAKQRRSFIVNVSAELLFSEKRIVFCGRDIVDRHVVQRKKCHG